MASTVSGDKSTEVYNITLDSTGDNVTFINLPAKYGALILYPRTNAAKLVTDLSGLTDGGAIGANAYKTLTADSNFTIPVDGMSQIALASGSSSTVIEVTWVKG